MRNLRMTLEYDGTDYHGWQRQINGLSIQQVLEEKIAVITGAPIKVLGSGRTDTGVHALGQVAHFKTVSHLSEINFLNGINSLLPRDIVVRDLREVDLSFHARFDVKSKIYIYQITGGPVRPVIYRRYAWYIPRPLDVWLMREASELIKGTHDFSSFCSTHSDAPDHIRTLMDIRIETGFDGLITIQMEADGFLRHMVRGVVGTLVEVGAGKRVPEDMLAILNKKDRYYGGMTAPPHGLFLKEVKY